MERDGFYLNTIDIIHIGIHVRIALYKIGALFYTHELVKAQILSK